MKKMLVIIIILLIIFIGMYICKYKSTSKSDINVGEVNKIETYITKIYMWKEITKEALPSFNSINDVNDLWIGEVVKKNIEDYEISYNKIQDKLKELFGSEYTKQYPKDTTLSFEYNKEIDKYYATETTLDKKEDEFMLNKISKTYSGYEVEIVEYLENYESNDVIKIENTNEENIINIENTTDETQIKQLIKDNIDKFSKKKLTLKKENETLYLLKCEVI